MRWRWLAAALFTLGSWSATPVALGIQSTTPVVQPDPKFDPGRDAAADLRAALAEAQKTHRRVILDVGGEWCSWCHTLDRYFVDHPDLRALRDQHYVWLKVNWSTGIGGNRNEAVLSKYPEPEAYPHLFVLDADGALLQSQRTDPLEEGPSYNFDRMKAFLLKWAPAR